MGIYRSVYRDGLFTTRGNDSPLSLIRKAGSPVLVKAFNTESTAADEGFRAANISSAVGTMLQAISSIDALQRLGQPIDGDVNEAFADAGIPVIEGVDVSYTRNSVSGEHTFVVRAENFEEVTLRYDQDGERIDVLEGDGKLIEIDQATRELMQVATSIQALQARGAKIDGDIDAAFKKAGIPIVESVDVQIADDTESGVQTFTLRGQSGDPVVMRFDADGSRIPDMPNLSLSSDVREAMAAAGEEAMSPRGALSVPPPWCAAARPGGGCAEPTSPNVSGIPGSTAPQFRSFFPAAMPVREAWSAAAMPLPNLTIPGTSYTTSYDAMSIAEFFNLGTIRTQAELDELLSFCWIADPAKSGSGACQVNYYGVCPYDQNAGITCQSMYYPQ
jgi:hypothetical protein